MIDFAHRLTVCSALVVVTLLWPVVIARADDSPSMAPATQIESLNDPTKSIGPAAAETAASSVSSAPSTTKTTKSLPASRIEARGADGAERARSYGWLLKKIRKAQTGDVVKVRLRQGKANVWIYDVTVLSDSGRYVQISLNASTGAVINRKKL